MIIGHEISHGFDAIRQNFESKSIGKISIGNPKSWWSKSLGSQLSNITKCMREQYYGYKVGSKTINGQKTLDENIADNSGLKLAFYTYKRHIQPNAILNAEATTEEPKIALTSDQLFFLGFAQSFCSISTQDYAENTIKSDRHSFSKYRVIGALSNSEDFSNAYNCPIGSLMNPIKKCRIW